MAERERELPEVSDAVMKKAKAYLTDGRLTVARLEQEAPRHGGGTEYQAEVYVQGSDPTTPYLVNVWGSIVKCGCPARVWACAHLVATLLVLDVPSPIDAASVHSLAGGSLDDLIEVNPQQDPPDPEGVVQAEVEVETEVERQIREERARELDRLLGL